MDKNYDIINMQQGVGNTHSLNYGGFMLEKVKDLIETNIKEKGYILDEVTYEKEGSNYFLRVVIDKDGFININDCVEANKIISPLLDDIKELDDNYILDVCSKEKGSV